MIKQARPAHVRKRVLGVLGGAMMRRADAKAHYNYVHRELGPDRLTGMSRRLCRAKGLLGGVKAAARYESPTTNSKRRKKW